MSEPVKSGDSDSAKSRDGDSAKSGDGDSVKSRKQSNGDTDPCTQFVLVGEVVPLKPGHSTRLIPSHPSPLKSSPPDPSLKVTGSSSDEFILLDTTRMSFEQENKAVEDARQRNPGAKVGIMYTQSFLGDMRRVREGLGFYDSTGRYRPHSFFA